MATIIATFIYFVTLTVTPNTDNSTATDSSTTTTECSVTNADVLGW